MADNECVKVDVASLPDAPSPAAGKKEVDEALGTSEIGFNVFTVRPGERMPWGYHYHPEHEEIFCVTDGTVSVDTKDGTIHLSSGKALYIPPGAGQKCYNNGEQTATVIALGAPKDRDGGIIEEECPHCGDLTGRSKEVEESGRRPMYRLFCTGCEREVDRFAAGPDSVPPQQ